MSNLRKLTFLAVGGVLVFGLSLGGIALFKKLSAPNPHWEQVAAPAGPSRAEREARFDLLITKAEAAAQAAVAARARQFHDFVAQRQYRTLADGRVAVSALAEDMLSLGSKGRLVWSKMPFTDRDGYKTHVSRLFSTHLFSAEELGAELNRAVDGAIKDVEAVENQLAVELQEVITGTPATPGLRTTAPGQFKDAMAKIIAAGQVDVGKDVVKLAASELVANIGVQVLVRVGVSAGILGTGAATGPWTLGAGVVIGVLADLAWGWIDNPHANIQRDVLRATSKLAVDGRDALNAEVSQLVQRRKNLWQMSATSMLP